MMRWTSPIKAGIAGLVCLLAVLFWSGVSLAQPIDFDDDGVVQAEEEASLPESATFISLPVQMTVQVDQTVCATGAVQCTSTGHTTEPAGPTNHNPVRFGIQVLTPRGHPIDGLPSGAFTVFNPFVPAGGTGVERLDCSACFQAAGQGLYTIFVHPSEAAGVVENWKSGSYFVQVQVIIRTPAGRLVRTSALAHIDIPFP